MENQIQEKDYVRLERTAKSMRQVAKAQSYLADMQEKRKKFK